MKIVFSETYYTIDKSLALYPIISQLTLAFIVFSLKYIAFSKNHDYQIWYKSVTNLISWYREGGETLNSLKFIIRFVF